MFEIITIDVFSLLKVFGFLAGSFMIAFGLTPTLTYFLYHFKTWKKQKTQAITGEKATIYQRLHAEKHHRNVPTLAGILIWFVVAIVTLMFNLSRAETYLPLFTIVCFGLVGLLDDLMNLRSSGRGVAGMGFKAKLIWLLFLGVLAGWWFYSKLDWSIIHIPGGNYFGLPYTVDIGLWYIPLSAFVIIFMANAVNLTDGLDGLAGGQLSISFVAYTVIALILGKFELAAFCATVSGATLAYTWFNIPPARFYMGDTGSLALGATLGVVAMLTNTIVLLPIIGFVYTIELLSSSIQIFSKKVFKRKVFRVAPIHHHFEAIGWKEEKVVMRFWIIGAIFSIIGLFIALVGKG